MLIRDFLLGALLGLLLSGSAAVAAGEPSIDTDPPGLPTTVEVGIYIVDLVRVDGAKQVFEADIVMQMRWQDPRLAGPGGPARRMDLSSVWNPRAQVVNRREITTTLPEVVEVSPDGTVVYRQRALGTFASHFDLHDFPRDQQKLRLKFVAMGYSPDQVHFRAMDDRIGRAERFTIADWNVGEAEVRVEPFDTQIPGVSIAGLTYELDVVRRVGYYLGKIVSSVMIILCMAWVVFWIDPSQLNPRISVSVTTMLTLIAYRFLVGQDLPRLPYLTRMDYFLLGATFLLLLCLMVVILTTRLLSGGNEELARKVNRASRWAYPTLFGMLVAFSAWVV